MSELPGKSVTASPATELEWQHPPTLADRGLRALPVLLGAIGLCTLAWTVAGRAAFPWPLEWMEGGILQHGQRLAAGLPLYAAPSAQFVPYLYPPLGYVPMALGFALGGELVAARALCTLGSLLAIVAIGRIGARACGGDPRAGLAAAGFFALGFGYTGAFLDIARIDGWFIALLVWGADRLHAGRTRSGLWLLALCGFAKQHGLLLFAVAALVTALRERRRALSSVAPPLIAIVLGLLLLQWSSDGWFSRYVFELPASHGMQPTLLLSFLLVDMLVYVPVATVGAALWLWRGRARLPVEGALLLAAVLASALGRAHPGGHDNVRLPAFALLCALGLAPLLRVLLDSEQRARRRVLLAALLTLQWALLWQPPAAHQPSAASRDAFAELRAQLERCGGPGDAVALDYPLLAGVPFVHTMALSDLQLGDDTGARQLARLATDALLARLEGLDAPAALAVGERFPALEEVLQALYRPCAVLAAPVMVTGYQPPDQTVYVQRDHAQTLAP